MIPSFADYTFTPPGWLLWCALSYAGTGSLLYAREAEFRFALVRVNEEIDGMALYVGEVDERERLYAVFAWN
jgi:putative ATP-binding cassette transporter